jgi:hypothetical protein
LPCLGLGLALSLSLRCCDVYQLLFIFVLFCFVLFCFILFYFILFYFILFYFALLCFALLLLLEGKSNQCQVQRASKYRMWGFTVLLDIER